MCVDSWRLPVWRFLSPPWHLQPLHCLSVRPGWLRLSLVRQVYVHLARSKLELASWKICVGRVATLPVRFSGFVCCLWMACVWQLPCASSPSCPLEVWPLGVSSSVGGLLCKFEFTVAASSVGALIGRNGVGLADISRLTGARVHISPKGELVPGTNDRRCVVSGQVGAAHAAHCLLLQKLHKHESAAALSATSGSQRAADLAGTPSGRGAADEQLQTPKSTPNLHAGTVSMQGRTPDNYTFLRQNSITTTSSSNASIIPGPNSHLTNRAHLVQIAAPLAPDGGAGDRGAVQAIHRLADLEGVYAPQPTAPAFADARSPSNFYAPVYHQRQQQQPHQQAGPRAAMHARDIAMGLPVPQNSVAAYPSIIHQAPPPLATSNRLPPWMLKTSGKPGHCAEPLQSLHSSAF
eukprot:GHVT01079870.1.p1 GENE.GHVT01079870.1~~GHVT01079870.1.p1  ORF type:complete len:407 (-),score=83.12 GHVT01079870.1:1055-2275(-)